MEVGQLFQEGPMGPAWLHKYAESWSLHLDLGAAFHIVKCLHLERQQSFV